MFLCFTISSGRSCVAFSCARSLSPVIEADYVDTGVWSKRAMQLGRDGRLGPHFMSFLNPVGMIWGVEGQSAEIDCEKPTEQGQLPAI